MTKQEEYVQNAVESLELAERLASSSDRRRMLKLAEAWVELAKIEPTTADVTPGAYNSSAGNTPALAYPSHAPANRDQARSN